MYIKVVRQASLRSAIDWYKNFNRIPKHKANLVASLYQELNTGDLNL